MAIMMFSCSKDEPTPPLNPDITIPIPTNPDNSGNGGDQQTIPGSEILGTWYYLNPNKALKITITFSSEMNLIGDRTCYISVESELPYFHTDYDNAWNYENSKWKVWCIEIGEGIMPSALISKVFENEMWLDLDWGNTTERLKFKRSNPGNPVKPSGFQIAPDGIFGKYVWHTTIGMYNLTLQFNNNSYNTYETSDRELRINGKYVKEATGEGLYSKGYLSLDYTRNLIPAAANCPYFVVIKETDKKLKYYNPFNPEIVYTFTRD